MWSHIFLLSVSLSPSLPTFVVWSLKLRMSLFWQTTLTTLSLSHCSLGTYWHKDRWKIRSCRDGCHHTNTSIKRKHFKAWPRISKNIWKIKLKNQHKIAVVLNTVLDKVTSVFYNTCLLWNQYYDTHHVVRPVAITRTAVHLIYMNTSMVPFTEPLRARHTPLSPYCPVWMLQRCDGGP